MKRLLLFTFLGPLIGSILIYVLTWLSFSTNNFEFDTFVIGSTLYIVFGYIYGIVPAIITGAIAYFLNFEKWIHILICIISAVLFTAFGLYIVNKSADFLWAIMPSFSASLFISLLIRWRKY